MWASTEAGSCARSRSIWARTSFATCTVFVPGWRWIASMTARWPPIQAAWRLFCTSSITRPRSRRRTARPLRQATIRSPKPRASRSSPEACTVTVRFGPHRMPVGRFTLPAEITPGRSSMPIPSERSACGSSCTRTAYFWEP